MAARLNGIHSVGIDSSRVAYAISSAKMVNVSPESIVKECSDILQTESNMDVPVGEFWEMMYDPVVLKELCALRQSLIEECDTPERIALRGILLGALHGPKKKDGSTSYLSNQFPRTFASKPAYSVRFWKKNGLTVPPKLNVLDIVNERAKRYYSEDLGPVDGFIYKGDSTDVNTFLQIKGCLSEDVLFDTVITSPPYHGMNTYIPDQWIRNWFVGGPDSVDYSTEGQTSGRLSTFIDQLSTVWKNCSDVCRDKAHMFVRFGDIGQKNDDPEEIIQRTFDETDWAVIDIHGAGRPKKSRRSSEMFIKGELRNYDEIDVSLQRIC